MRVATTFSGIRFQTPNSHNRTSDPAQYPYFYRMNTPAPTLSFWETSTWLRPDVIIVGAGIVGLSAAIHLKAQRPDKRILVLERGSLPTGASTKNAGFACFGSLSEIAADLESLSEEAVLSLLHMRWEGLQLLRKTLSDEQLGYEATGSYEVFTDQQEDLYQKSIQLLDRFNAHLQQLTGIASIFNSADDRIEALGFANVRHLILNTAEGQINTGSMMNALLQLARSQNITVLNGVSVQAFSEDEATVKVLTNTLGELQCQQVLIATNGFAAQLLPELDVQPGRAQVLITEPIPNLKFQGCFHMDEGYFYFRNVGNRILFGGGRNLDKAGETTYSHQTTSRIQQALEEYLRNVIIPNTPFTVSQRWAGTLGLGTTRLPIVRQIQSRVFCAVRMGGMGVAIGSLIGKDAAALLLSHDQ